MISVTWGDTERVAISNKGDRTMKILTLTGLLLAFALGSSAFAEGVSDEDIECGNNRICLETPMVEEDN